MPQSGGSFQEKLQQLRQEYTDLLPLKLKEIDLAWVGVCERPKSTETTRQLRTYVHTLAGSGATFGFAELSARASQLEDLVDQLISAPENFPQLEHPIADGIRELHLAANHGNTPDDSVPHAEKPAASAHPATMNERIFWLGNNSADGAAISHQLKRFCYGISIFIDAEAFWQEVMRDEPDVVLLDLGDEKQPFPKARQHVRRLADLKINVICICQESSNLSKWLEYIRSGAVTCINRPVSLYNLLDKLDPLTFHWQEDPYKLFIIDDDVSLARNMATILTKAGMQVEVETNPIRVMKVLETFTPDLILIDLYMPQCSGTELSRLIRQENKFLTVPIVYLSAEDEINNRLEALEAGADDFILKPVKLRFLYHAISSRIKRARKLSEFHQRDVLTGLLNHTSFQEHLRGQLWHSIQEKESMVVALVDIDRFKAINDHHGHQMGDKVLRTLAIKLKRRFANMAVIARYDGATYALLFPNANAEKIKSALDEVRVDFAEVDHEADSGVFETSFSSGLADYPNFGNATDLLDACQKALMQAKVSGRNCVVPLMESGILSLSGDAIMSTMETAGESTEGMFFLDDEAGDEDALFLDDEDTEIAPEPLVQPLAPVVEDGLGKGKKVVVVDDDRQLLQVITGFLESKGFEVYAAPTGDEGFTLVEKHHPGLIIIDLLLFPGIHGFELCKKIKTNSLYRSAKVILMTAVYKDYRYQMEGKEAGGDAFLIKPINFDELLQTIRTLDKPG